jgi:ribosomal protein S19E (S16A)
MKLKHLKKLANILQKFSSLGLYDFKHLKDSYSTGEIHISEEDKSSKQKSVQKLQELGYIKHTEDNKYSITSEGRKKLEDMLASGEYRNPKTNKKRII